MQLRIPLFGLVADRSPMEKLMQLYDKVVEGVDLMEESLTCYVGEGPCRQFQELYDEVNRIEDEADKIKRSIRNHLPRGLLMPVDKTVFLNFTRNLDDIIDDGQEAVNWAAMRRVEIPENFRGQLVELISGVTETVHRLGPAMRSTVDLVLGSSYNREKTKETFRAVREQHKKVWHIHMDLLSTLFNADINFSEQFQLVRLVESLEGISHNTEGCADNLRAMISR